jgi:hypothetical protein
MCNGVRSCVMKRKEMLVQDRDNGDKWQFTGAYFHL